jgi:hypothetical protein
MLDIADNIQFDENSDEWVIRGNNDKSIIWGKYEQKLDNLYRHNRMNLCHNILSMMKVIPKFIYVPALDRRKDIDKSTAIEHSKSIWNIAISFALLDHEHGNGRIKKTLFEDAEQLFELFKAKKK